MLAWHLADCDDFLTHLTCWHGTWQTVMTSSPVWLSGLHGLTWQTDDGACWTVMTSFAIQLTCLHGFWQIGMTSFLIQLFWDTQMTCFSL